MYIINHRSFFFWFTGVLLAAAIGAIVAFGLPMGIDFTGGSLIQVSYQADRPAVSIIQEKVAPLALGTVSVRATGDNAVSIRTRTLTPAEHEQILAAISLPTSPTELSYTSVGPALGSQFASKAIWAIFAVIFVIVLYIAFAFRKVSKPVPGWGYGITVVAMLAIDIIVPTGFFAAYCHFTGAEVDSHFSLSHFCRFSVTA